MSDQRFFRANGPFALEEVAQWANGELSDPGRGAALVSDIADLEHAGEQDVSLFSSPDHAQAFAASHAGLVVTSRKLSLLPHNGSVLLLAENPRFAFARIGQLFYPRQAPEPFIHPRAAIAASARIEAGAAIAAGVVIGENVAVGPRCRIGANSVIEDGVVIGADVSIGANAAIGHALIADRVSIGSHVSIGGAGFGFVPAPDGPMRMCQVGRVIIGEGVDIGSNCAIDRGCLGDTVIGAMTAIDNLVQIGHNVRIGKGCVLAGQAGVAGSTTLGDFVMVGGAVSISDHLTIGDGARIAGKSGVMRDVAPREVVAGYPAVPVRQWHKQSAALARLIARACGKTGD